MPSTPTCPTCEVPMEGGYLIEQNLAVIHWMEARRERSAWTGLTHEGRRQFAMYAWRCPRCSEVRLFAPEV